MPTRTGNATADLVALLRRSCPNVAQETLERLAFAVAALDDAAGPAGGDGGDGGDGADGTRLRWSKLTLGDIPGVKEFVTTAKAPIEVVNAVLQFVAGILEVVSNLLIAIPDPYRALILAAYQILKDIVDDLLASGAYVYFDAPGLTSNVATLTDMGMAQPDLPKWVAGDKPKRVDPPADGFQQWAFRFKQSFDDAGDHNRPVFSDGAPVEALFIVATAPQLPDLAAIGPLFEKLFDVKAFGKAWEHFAAGFPSWPDDPDRSRLRGTSVHPDWVAWRLRDIGPDTYPLRELEKIPEALLKLLMNVDDIVGLLKKLIAAVKAKIEVLRQIIEVIQQIIDALAALTATGLAALVVVSDEGVEGLVKAFLEAEKRPNTDAEGNVLTANAVIGVCLLTGTSELVPANAVPIWELFGQGRSMSQAYSGLTKDWQSLQDKAEAAAADTEALATRAWEGMENGGTDPSSAGIKGLWGGLTETYEEQRDEVLGVLGLTEAEADERTKSGRSALMAGLEQALAEGSHLNPVVLAHLEATRRARRRGRRSLAMSFGPRLPEQP